MEGAKGMGKRGAGGGAGIVPPGTGMPVGDRGTHPHPGGRWAGGWGAGWCAAGGGCWCGWMRGGIRGGGVWGMGGGAGGSPGRKLSDLRKMVEVLSPMVCGNALKNIPVRTRPSGHSSFRWGGDTKV